MYKFDKMLVCLDLSNMDRLLIMYANYIAKLLDAKEVAFMHVMEEVEFPEELAKDFPDLAEPLDDIIEEELQKKIRDNFDADQTSYSIEITSGNTTQRILKFAKDNDIDLTVLGKKSSFEGTGVLLGSIAKFIHASVLFLPENAHHNLKKVLVPIDFSEESQVALQETIRICEQAGAEVDIQHVYELPKQYFPYNAPTDVLKKKMQQHLDKKYSSFLEGVDTMGKNIEYFFTLSEDRTMSENIYNKAIFEQCDIVVMGSKTKTAATALFKGSTAEKLAKANYSIPLMIIKDKNKTEGLFESLLK